MPDPTGRYPSVTQVLQPYADFGQIPEAVLAHAAERGQTVHRACAAVARGQWVPPLGDEIDGYVASFRAWFGLAVVEVVAVEERLYNHVLGYCGQPDIICRLKGDREGLLTLIDLKTPTTEGRLWAMQLAAYRELAEHNGITVDRVVILRLKPDGGRPILTEYTSNNLIARAAWLNALNVWRYLAA